MIAIDTNILLRWIASDVVGDEDARHQSILIEEVLAACSEPIFINQIVLAEMMWVLRRRVRVSKQILVDVVTSLLDTINVVIDDRDTVAAALDSYVQHPGDFPDHLIGQINKRNGCRTTLTFDKAAANSPNFSALQR
jgi:predicted nucleic-acid-binding protein